MSLENQIQSQLKSFQLIQENVDINQKIEILEEDDNLDEGAEVRNFLEIRRLEERKKEIKKELDIIFEKYPDLKLEIE